MHRTPLKRHTNCPFRICFFAYRPSPAASPIFDWATYTVSCSYGSSKRGDRLKLKKNNEKLYVMENLNVKNHSDCYQTFDYLILIPVEGSCENEFSFIVEDIGIGNP